MEGRDREVARDALKYWFDTMVSKAPSGLNLAVAEAVTKLSPGVDRDMPGGRRALASIGFFYIYHGRKHWPSLPTGQRDALQAVIALSGSMGKVIDHRTELIPDWADYELGPEIVEEVAHWAATDMSVWLAKGWMKATSKYAKAMLKVMRGSEGCPKVDKRDAEKYLRMVARTRLKDDPMSVPHGNHVGVILERVVYR
jgi:hypothetical protein